MVEVSDKKNIGTAQPQLVSLKTAARHPDGDGGIAECFLLKIEEALPSRKIYVQHLCRRALSNDAKSCPLH